MNTHARFTKWLAMIFLLALVTILLAACDPTGPVPPAQTPKPDFDIRRETPVVNAGPTDPLPALNDAVFHPFPPGHRVNTNNTGEALVQGDVGGKTCKIFVFRNTSLVKKACPRSSFQGSNTVCNEEGSALFIDCSSQLILTNTGAFQVKGSWVWVTYLPESQISLVAVLEGETDVQPVLNIDSGEMGEGMSLGPGQFYYTMPDDMMMEVGSLQPRRVYPFERLPEAIDNLGLHEWSERVQVRADEGGVPYLDAEPVQPSSDKRVYVRGGGGVLNEFPIQDSVGRAVDWSAIHESIFADETEIFFDLPDIKLPDAREFPFDPEFSKAMLAEMGYPEGFPVRLLAYSYDDQLWTMAEWLIGMLGDVGIQVELMDVTPGDAEAIFAELISASEPVLWLSR
ncbi:MAG: hypothetical protein J5I90_20625 [Caldilineales bacterium]|nr:hypothetical protein [Caldilineales bacterium]